MDFLPPNISPDESSDQLILGASPSEGVLVMVLKETEGILLNMLLSSMRMRVTLIYNIQAANGRLCDQITVWFKNGALRPRKMGVLATLRKLTDFFYLFGSKLRLRTTLIYYIFIGHGRPCDQIMVSF